MRALSELSVAVARRVRVVFTDIDDTLTTDGLLEKPAFESLWRLCDAGISVVPVTGRPAGWCDHIARMWPVAGVVGENGGLFYAYDRVMRRMVRRYARDEETRASDRAKLALVKHEILKRVPRARVSADQPFRELDLAIDFAEDVGPLSGEEIDEIVAVFEAHGAVAKVSSIHVNGWYGTHDKVGMIKIFSLERLQIDLEAEREAAVYVGDSPNDEPAFASFSLSVGVANVVELAGRFRTLPVYVTPSRGGRGFSELAELLLAART
ncbi:MAG: HAD-IIB family hydrolase [Deltaproteobacteria bacterium]|nr:HAD-IIB family hydrolase [Deltaproteobacteria bacterium]